MRITELLDKRSISLAGAPANKEEALDQVVELMVRSGRINDKEAYRRQVYAREEESTTGIGEGIAIPHGKCDAVTSPGLAAMVVKDGVDFDALDGEPVTLIFLIAAPNTEDNVHLDVLSKLSVLMMDEDFSDSLRNAASVEEFLAIIDKADDEKAGIDERLADTGSADADQVKILAVTSCPTGIAHTYMAAEGIEKAAKREAVLSRSRQEVPAEPKMSLRRKKLKRLTASLSRPTRRCPWIVLPARKLSNVRFRTESARQVSCWTVLFAAMCRFMWQRPEHGPRLRLPGKAAVRDTRSTRS